MNKTYDTILNSRTAINESKFEFETVHQIMVVSNQRHLLIQD